MDIGTIAELWRYPVKSMGGERLNEATLGTGGIANDRGWAIRETETGKVASAKQPRAYRALLDLAATADGDHDDAVVTITGPSDLHVCSNDADHGTSLSRALGRPVTLDRAGEVDALYESEWPDMEGLVISNMTLDLPVAMSTEKTSYVDLAALHLVSTASLAALAALTPDSAVDVRRFRPNLVIDTGNAPGFVDVDWVGQDLAIGDDVVIRISDNATRCVMTTLAQGELAQDRSVLQTLATHNQQEFGGLGRSACLGVYAEVVTGGMMRAGDAVRVAS
jgi:Uncharacterized Fe-S protein